MRMLRLLPTDPPGDRTGDPHQTRRYSHGCEEEDCQEGREEGGEEGRQEDQEALVLRGPETTRKPARSMRRLSCCCLVSSVPDGPARVTRPAPSSLSRSAGGRSWVGCRRRGLVPRHRPRHAGEARLGFRARSRSPPAPLPGRPDVARSCVALLLSYSRCLARPCHRRAGMCAEESGPLTTADPAAAGENGSSAAAGGEARSRLPPAPYL